MTTDIYAQIGHKSAPVYEYDFTQEYLMKLRGANYIPVRNRSGYHLKSPEDKKSNYVTPRMQKLNQARKNSRTKK